MVIAADLAENKASRVTKEAAPVRCVFLPYILTNPYQRSLEAALVRQGVVVEHPPASLWILGPLLSGEGRKVVHLHWLHPFTLTNSLLGSLAKTSLFLAQLAILRLLGKRIFWTAHNLGDHDRRFPFIDRLSMKAVARLSHGVIAHCHEARRRLCSEIPSLRGSKITVVPHGNYIHSYPNDVTREQARQALGLSGESVVFLFLGAIRRYKGVAELVAEFRKLSDRDATLVIAGRPRHDADLPALTAAVGADQRIKLISEFVPDEQLQLFLNAADLVVFPYSDVLTSGAVILAMSFGRPCLAPKLGCIRETLDERGALLYDPADEDGLRAALEAAAVRREELPAMGRHNLRLAEQLNWDEIGHTTASLYRSTFAE
jgi:beta-1,4-mannosyltransferase